MNRFNKLLSGKNRQRYWLLIQQTISENVVNVFHPCYAGKVWKMQQLPVILDVRFRKTLAGKSLDYRDVVVFEKLCFFKMFPVHTKKQAGVLKFLILKFEVNSIFVTV